VKVFVYMNHRIREKKPRGPVIVVQRGNGSGKVEGNMVVINGPCVVRFDPRGLPIAEEHHVTAWIEADLSDVVVR
jgi:hypothetical protein